MSFISLVCEYLVSSCWTCVGRFRTCGFAGESISLEAVSEVSEAMCHSQLALSASCLLFKM